MRHFLSGAFFCARRFRCAPWTALIARAALLVLASAFARGVPAQPAAHVVFGTNWFAEAEHGGFYQAQAEGLYRKEGLDVEVTMGGPQINGLQLLLAGRLDMFMGYDLQVLE